MRFIILPGKDVMNAADYKLIERDNTIIGAACLIGVAFGTLIGGEFISTFGRRKVILWSNICIVLLSIVSIVPSFLILTIARFFFGINVGFSLVAALKIMIETIPSNLLDFCFASSTNLSIFFFLVLNTSLGLLNGSVLM